MAVRVASNLYLGHRARRKKCDLAKYPQPGPGSGNTPLDTLQIALAPAFVFTTEFAAVHLQEFFRNALAALGYFALTRLQLESK